jgi:hypothetical protein
MDAILPNAGAISEFQGFTGGCGETAELVFLHIYKGVPLDAANLNALVREQIKQGEAGSKGEETLAAIARDLTEKGLAYERYGYAEPFNYDWRKTLQEHAGSNGIILQLARAGNLPGDEKGVKYHFIAIVGQKGGSYITADGDNVAARKNQLVTYSEPAIASAAPCGLILITTPVPQPPKPAPAPAPKPGPSKMLDISQASQYFIQLDASHWKCKMNGYVVRDGMLSAYRNWQAAGSLNGLTEWGLPLGNEQPVPGKPNVAVQRFERCRAVYDPNRTYDNPPGASGAVYLGHV